jgi:hypothetical protein
LDTFIANPQVYASIEYPANETSPAPAGLVSERFPSGIEFQGYCPVVLYHKRKFTDGSPHYAAVYQGKYFTMADESALAEFRRYAKGFHFVHLFI